VPLQSIPFFRQQAKAELSSEVNEKSNPIIVSPPRRRGGAKDASFESAFEQSYLADRIAARNSSLFEAGSGLFYDKRRRLSERTPVAPRKSGLPSLIGVIHLSPLPGSPRSGEGSPSECLQAVGYRAVQEARMLCKAGFEAIILENFGDTPFYKDQVPPETVTSLAVIAAAVREVCPVPLGINVLRNDARSALAVAAITGCEFIRVNILSGAAATDQGIMEGQAAFLLRERERLRASNVRIFADVLVKHAKTLSTQDLELCIEEAAFRAGADAVIITGTTTGREVDMAELKRASEICRAQKVPLYIGSGATAERIPHLLALADGVIVGSAIRKSGQAGFPLDAARIKAFVKQFRQSRTKKPKKKR
jgi:membrane complex biogenesis BtpA family protein